MGVSGGGKGVHIRNTKAINNVFEMCGYKNRRFITQVKEIIFVNLSSWK